MSSAPATRGLSDAERSQRTAELLHRAATASGSERESLVHLVVELNLRIAHAVARRFRGRGVPLEDLEQVAALALVRAARRFDIAQDRDFLSYAVPSMSGEVKRYFRDLGWTIRPPRRIQDIQTKVMALSDIGGPDGTMGPGEIAHELGVPVADVEEAIAVRGLFNLASLDLTTTGPSGDGNLPIGELLPADDPEPDRMETRVLLEPVLRRLSERDRRVLYLRFHDEQTQAEIGEELGVTQTQVSRLLVRILRVMREELADDVHQPAAAAGTARSGSGRSLV